MRYVDIDRCQLREDILECIPIYSMEGEALASKIKSCLVNHGLGLENLRGQDFDGASLRSMSGGFSDYRAFLREEQPKAIYMHCCSHRLILCLNDAAKTTLDKNGCSTLNDVCNFIRRSGKRGKVLRDELEAYGLKKKQFWHVVKPVGLRGMMLYLPFVSAVGIPIVSTVENRRW